MNRKTFIIDGTNFSNIDEFYDEIQRVLTDDFTGFGRNLDAFNDILRGGFGKFDFGERIELVWKSSNKSKSDLGYAETVKYLNKYLLLIHPDLYDEQYKKIKRAAKHSGPTLYDELIEIIRDNKNIHLTLM